MADFSLGTELTSTYGSPTIYYTLTLKSKTRTSNSQMKYVFNVHVRMGGTLGTGYGLIARVNGYDATLKTTSESMSVWKSGYTKDVQLTAYATSTTGNATQTLTFSVRRNNDASGGDGGALSSKTFNVTSSQLLYTKITPPTTITPSANIIAPNTPLTISWSGAQNGINNIIQEYSLYYTTNNSVNIQTDNHVYTNSTSYSFANFGGEDDRGETYRFAIQVRGSAGPDWVSDLSDNISVRINQLPNITNASVNNSIVPYNRGNGGMRTFTMEGNIGQDDTGQTLSYAYATTNSVSEAQPITNGATLAVKGNAGTNITYYFWAYDGLEYSTESRSVNLAINSLPIVNSVNITSSPYTFDTKHLTQTFNGSITSTPGSQANHVNEYIWWYSLQEGSGEGIITYVNTITNYNIRSNISSPNTPFALGVSVIDNLRDESEIKWINYDGSSSDAYSQAFVTPKDMIAPTNLNVYNSLNGTNTANVSNNSFYKNISATWLAPNITTTNGYFPLDHYELRINDTPIVTNITSDAITANYNNLTFNNGEFLEVKLIAFDTLGRSNSIVVNSTGGETLIMSSPPTFSANATIAFAPDSFRVYHEYYINPSTANTRVVNIGLNGAVSANGDNGLNLKANITVGNTTIHNNIGLEKHENMWQASLGSDVLKEDFEEAFTAPLNEDYNATVTLTPYNNFGQEGPSIQGTYLFKFIEAPILSGDRILNVKYYSSSTAQKIAASTDPSGTTYPTDSLLINTGDVIQLQLHGASGPPVIDYNTDVIKYRIFCCRNNSIVNDPSTLIYDTTPLLEQDYNSQAQTITMEVAMPQYSVSKFLYFKIDAIDSNNNVSNTLYFPTYLVGSRVQSPTILLSEAAVDDDYHFTGSWKVTDLGGNNFEDEAGSYEVYHNLERVGYPQAYTASLARPIIKIEYADNINFVDSTLTGNLNTKTLNTTDFSFSNFLQELNFSDLDVIGEVIDDSRNFRTKNLYIRLLVAFPTATIITNGDAPTGQFKPATGEIITPSDYNGGSTISSYIYGYSNTVLFYAESPTVAYRKHMLGINTKQFSTPDDTILLIKDFDDKRFLYFDGVLVEDIENNGTTQTISTPHVAWIDLKTGQINNFLIDGGTWDS